MDALGLVLGSSPLGGGSGDLRLVSHQGEQGWASYSNNGEFSQAFRWIRKAGKNPNGATDDQGSSSSYAWEGYTCKANWDIKLVTISMSGHFSESAPAAGETTTRQFILYNSYDHSYSGSSIIGDFDYYAPFTSLETKYPSISRLINIKFLPSQYCVNCSPFTNVKPAITSLFTIEWNLGMMDYLFN